MLKKKQTLHEQIVDLAQREYRETERRFIPLWPWILVRVLPKEAWSASGNILMPDNQNKVIYEGIVLEVYEPKEHPYKTEDGREGIEILTSQLKPGDHIGFPHWDGFAVPFLNEHTHRCVREFVPDAKGGIPWKIIADEIGIQSQLAAVFDFSNSTFQLSARDVANDVMEKFNVIPKDHKPKTLSGV